MKKILLVCVALAVLLAGGLWAGGSKEPAKAENKLEIFSWWTAGGEADGLQAMFKIFKQKYPNVEIINATVAGGAGQNAKAVLATRMQGGNPPDSFQVHAGRELTDTWVVAGKMEPIDMVFEGIKDKYPKGVLEIISYQGHIYSVPVNIHRSNVVWYNKKVFEKNGITPPKTLDEFVAVAEKLASRGVTPIALGDNGIWASVHTLESILLAVLGPEKYRGLWNGSVKWDSAEAKKALSAFTVLLKYVNTDHAALSWDQAAQYVADGTAAMTIMGDWAHGYFKSKGLKGGVDYGWFVTPGTNGSFIMLSDSFGLPKGAPHRENAVNWLKVCASIEGQDAFNPLKGSIPSRIDANLSLYDEYLKSSMADFKTNEIVPSVAHGAAAAEGWVTKIQDIMTIFVTDKNVDKAAAAFAEAAKAYAK